MRDFVGLPGPELGFLLSSPVHSVVLVQASGIVEAASPAAIADLGRAPDQVVSRPCEMAIGLDLDRIVAAADTEGVLHRSRTSRFRVARLHGSFDSVAYLVEFSAVAAEQSDFDDLVVSRAERLEVIVNDLSDRYDELNRFVGVVSHDLQAPLRRLQSFVELLRGDLDAPSEAVQSSIEQIESGARHMLRLTTELLAYARLGTGPMALDTVDADAVLATTLTQLDQKLEAAGAAVRVHGPIGSVQATETFLGLVFQNLLENAVRYRRPEETPEIDITVDEADDIVEIRFRDRGRGVPTADQDVIFEPFRRMRSGGDATSSFGLAAVQRVVGRFGGDVFVTDPAQGPGAEFVLRLRRHENTPIPESHDL